jgi:hypothetical protein
MMAQSKKSPVLEKGKKRRRIKQQKGLFLDTQCTSFGGGWPADGRIPWRRILGLGVAGRC